MFPICAISEVIPPKITKLPVPAKRGPRRGRRCWHTAGDTTHFFSMEVSFEREGWGNRESIRKQIRRELSGKDKATVKIRQVEG